MLLLSLLAWVLAGGLALLLTVLGLECWLALVSRSKPNPVTRSLPVAILIPAHNEASGIAKTLELLKQEIALGDRILVVADNCSDATAAIAREHGAEVLEREHATLRGKGFALEAGVLHLAKHNPPEQVVIFDADCEFTSGSLPILTATCDRTKRPVQARYLMRLPKVPGPEASVSAFAFLVKNWVRPLALQSMGLPVMLNGTGMAFPWELIRRAPLGSSEIVEDLALGLHFVLDRKGPVFCPNAHVWSELPSDPKVAILQRTRWEHGYLGSILRDVPRLLARSISHGSPSLWLVALDLAIPPLALLAVLSLLGLAILAAFALFTGVWGPLLFLLGAGVFAGVGIAVAWSCFARELIPARVILSIPGYILRKLNIYQRFVTKREKQWVRTERE
jgi:cellulose synthase/poly-beta-1,6-N-acetylglucosamine synthase-like glycosyltransferase